MNSILLDSDISVHDCIKYIILNIPKNINYEIKKEFGLFKISLYSCNGLFDYKIYYINKEDILAKRDSELFMICKCYIDLFIEWFEKNDIKITYSNNQLNHFIKEIVSKTKKI